MRPATKTVFVISYRNSNDINSDYQNNIKFRCASIADCVTVMITTRGRMDAVERLVNSITRSRYSDIRVIVLNVVTPGKVWVSQSSPRLW